MMRRRIYVIQWLIPMGVIGITHRDEACASPADHRQVATFVEGAKGRYFDREPKVRILA
jgi:hypothetical protein